MNYEKIRRLVEFDSPTVANGLELLEVQDPTVGYTGPDVRALMPELGPRVGIAVTARMDSTTAGTEKVGSLFNDWLRAIQQAARSAGAEGLPVFAVMESVGPRPRYTVTIGDGMGTRMMLAGAPVDLTTGNVNVIWQGDANSHVLRCLARCTAPTTPLNVSGPETASVRALALAFGERFGRKPEFEGTESGECWLVNTGEAARLFGNPSVSLLRMVDWTADWLLSGGGAYGKPTEYASRDGAF